MEKLDLILVIISLSIIGIITIYAIINNKKSKKESGSNTIGSSLIMEDPNDTKNHDSSSLD
jgi:hypothetical protein